MLAHSLLHVVHANVFYSFPLFLSTLLNHFFASSSYNFFDRRACYTWGYGGHGNLGHGDRRSEPAPRRVKAFEAQSPLSFKDVAYSPAAAYLPACAADHLSSRQRMVVAVACTVGQRNCSGGLDPPTQGQEGPHTLFVVAEHGQRNLYSCGTCHKVRDDD